MSHAWRDAKKCLVSKFCPSLFKLARVTSLHIIIRMLMMIDVITPAHSSSLLLLTPPPPPPPPPPSHSTTSTTTHHHTPPHTTTHHYHHHTPPPQKPGPIGLYITTCMLNQKLFGCLNFLSVNFNDTQLEN